MVLSSTWHRLPWLQLTVGLLGQVRNSPDHQQSTRPTSQKSDQSFQIYPIDLQPLTGCCLVPQLNYHLCHVSHVSLKAVRLPASRSIQYLLVSH